MLAWAYNEEALIGSFLERALAALEEAVDDYELILVDDGSTDRTNEIARAHARRNPRLRVITNERNMNIGPSFKRALAAARKEFLFWQTVDWAYDLTHLRIFLELLKHYDVVVGIRPVPVRLVTFIPVIGSIYRVRGRSDNLRKAVVSLGNYYLLRVLYGMDFQDFQNIHFYPTAVAQSFTLQGNSSFLAPELLARAMGHGCRWRNWFRWGWRFRLSRRGAPRQIWRVAEPFILEEEVLRLVIPFFKSFRSRQSPR